MMNYEKEHTMNVRPFRTMRPGHFGGLVYSLKRLLNEKVCPQTQNGEFDEVCRLAVVTFQSVKGLTRTGSVDEVTWDELNKSEAIL